MGSQHVKEAPRREGLMRAPHSKQPFSKSYDRKRIANLLSDTHELLVELGEMDLRDATEEFRRMRADLEKRLRDEREFIDNI